MGDGQFVMPFYLIIDMSGSMENDIDAVQWTVNELIRELRVDQAVDDMALLSIIAFGTDAEVIVPLSRLSDIDPIKDLRLRGLTSYSAAWRAYDSAVRTDFATIRANNGSMHRPCVFFLTDGLPTESGYQKVFDSLQGAESVSYWPYVVAFGFRKASTESLESLAYPRTGAKRGRWFLSTTATASSVLQEIRHLLAHSVMMSSATAAAGKPTITVEEPGPDTVFDLSDQVDSAFR